MSSSTKITLLLLVLLVAIAAIASQFISVREAAIRQEAYTVNAGELTRDVLVGQTFHSAHANLSAIAVLFATYSNRTNTAPVYFHLRQSLDATEDLRQVTVQPDVLGDNQLYRFTFEPVPDSANKTYFFFVTAPEGTSGHAVTVDLDTRNPYHLGSAFVVRGQGPRSSDPGVLARSGKQTQDIGFATYHTVPLRVATVNAVRQTVYHTMSTWEEQRGQYITWARALIPALVFVGFAWLLHVKKKHDPAAALLSHRRTMTILLHLFVLAFGLRLMYAVSLPLTEDEGNYLYDARTLREGSLAGGDGYVKSPLSIVWIAVWQLIGSNSILGGRLSSMLIGALTIFPIYSLGRQLKDRSSGLLAAAGWATIGAAIVFNIYVHTQPLALFFGISGLAVLWKSLRQGEATTLTFGLPTRLSPGRGLVWAGMLLGLGVASRKSILALGLVPLVLILIEGTSWRQRMRYLVAVGVGFAIVIGLFLGLATWLYGPEGFWEALGVNSATDGIATRDISEIENERAYSLRGMTPFFRESLPLILLALLAWGYVCEDFLRRLMQRVLPSRPTRSLRAIADQILPKIGWVPALMVYAWCFQFFFEYEGAAFMFYGMPLLWYGMGGVLVLLALWPRSREEALIFAEKPLVAASTQPSKKLPPNIVGAALGTTLTLPLPRSKAILPTLATALLLPTWVGGLAFFYVNWIKFHANYISEFIPPLVIASGLGMYVWWQRFGAAKEFVIQHPLTTIVRRVVTVFATFVLIWALFLSNYITYVYEHTGTFDQSAAKEAAAWARENIPLDQPIFTGASLVTYLSGHHNALNISHPRWYAYESTRKDTQRLNTFMPSAEDMVQAYRDAQWFLLDKQTGFSYLMEYSEIEKGLTTDWQLVHEVENGSNPLKFYRRIK